MRKVVFAINSTADGYFGHTDGIADEELHRYFTGLLRTADVLLYGRITYQMMVPYWPNIAETQSGTESTNEFARVFDAIDKIVFSTTLNSAGGSRTTLRKGNLANEVLALKQQSGKDICVGSLSLASQLSERGLIDEYRFVIHPVIAGKGPRLFETVKMQERLMLDFIGAEPFRSGAVALHYRKRG